MSCSFTIRTRQYPCGTVFKGTIRKVNMQTKLHRQICKTCDPINPEIQNVNTFVGYKYSVSKYGNETVNNKIDAFVNNAIKNKGEIPSF